MNQKTVALTTAAPPAATILALPEMPQPRLTLDQAVVLRLAATMQESVSNFLVKEQCGRVVLVSFHLVGRPDPLLPLPLINMPRGFNEALRELCKLQEWFMERRAVGNYFKNASAAAAQAVRYLAVSGLTPEEQMFVKHHLALAVAYPCKVA
jgi:hypothetical protein